LRGFFVFADKIKTRHFFGFQGVKMGVNAGQKQGQKIHFNFSAVIGYYFIALIIKRHNFKQFFGISIGFS